MFSPGEGHSMGLLFSQAGGGARARTGDPWEARRLCPPLGRRILSPQGCQFRVCLVVAVDLFVFPPLCSSRSFFFFFSLFLLVGG